MGWHLTINQFDSLVDYPDVLKKFGRQVQWEYIRKVRILGKDLYISLFGYQNGNLRSIRKVNIEQGRVERRGWEWYDVNYKGFILWVKRCSYKLIFIY